jgi:hypothetical protein
MAERNRRLIRNQSAPPVAVGARLLRDEDVSAALLLVGFLTCVMAVRVAAAAAAAQPDAGVLLAGSSLLAGGLGAMWAAVWVAADAARRRDAGRVGVIILCATLLVVAVGICNDLDLFFAILRAVA